jgi:hypothetical protein
MGGAGDEIADPVCAGEHGYCITVGPASRFGCVDFDPEFTFVFFGVGLMGALPGRGATADGSFCVGWIGAGARSEGGWGRTFSVCWTSASSLRDVLAMPGISFR